MVDSCHYFVVRAASLLVADKQTGFEHLLAVEKVEEAAGIRWVVETKMVGAGRTGCE